MYYEVKNSETGEVYGTYSYKKAVEENIDFIKSSFPDIVLHLYYCGNFIGEI